MSLDRRTFVLLSSTACATSLTGGCTLLDTPDGGPDPGRQVPPDDEVLHIRSEGEHAVPEGGVVECRMIRWEPRGTLTVEPGGSLVVEGEATDD